MQVVFRPKRREVFAWTTCTAPDSNYPKRLVRVGLKKSMITRKMDLSTRKEYDFASSAEGIVGCKVDMDERSVCAVANAG
jgi:hypothetical protein